MAQAVESLAPEHGPAVDDGTATRDQRGEWAPRVLMQRTGFDDTKRDVHASIESFHHYLHHRYFECNYGDNVLPWDRWFGTLHDATEESRQRMRRKRRMPTEAKGLV